VIGPTRDLGAVRSLVDSPATAASMLALCDFAASRSGQPFEFLRGWLVARSNCSTERETERHVPPVSPDPRREPDEGAVLGRVPLAPRRPDKPA